MIRHDIVQTRTSCPEVRQTMGLYLPSFSTTTGLGLKGFVNNKLIGVTDIDGSL